MRINRRLGNYSAGKSTALISVYGAANENVTITHSDGAAYTATTDSSGYGGELELPFGGYTVKGRISGYSKSVTVEKNTTRINAWPDDVVMYFWHGTMPNGSWNPDGFNGGSSVKDTSVGTVQDGTLYVFTGDSYSNGIIGMNNVADLTGIDKIHFNVVSCSSIADSYIVVSKTKDVADKVLEVHPTSTGAHTVTIDVSNLSGKYYIFMYVHVYNGWVGRELKVSKVYASVDPSGTEKTLENSIAIGNTYRYANSLMAGDWVKVSSLSFGNINYVGQGTEDYNAMMVPVPAFSYSGTFKKLKLALYLWTSSSSNHTFRWAVTTSTANAEAYKVGSGAVTDSYQLGQGTWTPPYSDSYQWYTIDLNCDAVASGTPIYIYLWRNNTTYGNIHVMQQAVVTLNYAKN